MNWKYIERGEFPELGDVCLIVKKADGFYVATFFPRNCYFSTGYGEEILGKDIVKWINIGEIKDDTERGDDDGGNMIDKETVNAMKKARAKSKRALNIAVAAKSCIEALISMLNVEIDDYEMELRQKRSSR